MCIYFIYHKISLIYIKGTHIGLHEWIHDGLHILSNNIIPKRKNVYNFIL